MPDLSCARGSDCVSVDSIGISPCPGERRDAFVTGLGCFRRLPDLDTWISRFQRMASGAVLRADQLIMDVAAGARILTAEELHEVLEHVARAGFDANARERARGELAGLVWQDQVLRGSTLLPPAERHYVKHVLLRREWPAGTSLEDYLESARQTILNSGSSVFLSAYRGQWQLAVIGESGNWRGPHGNEFIVVEYRVETGHWTTVFQPRDMYTDFIRTAGRERVRWLRRRI